MNRSTTVLLSSFGALTALMTATTISGSAWQQGKAHAAPATPVMTVYKSPTCGCCKKWVEHVMAAGFDTKVVDLDDAALDTRKSKLGVVPRLQSCHTAVVSGYVIEGHVPAADIQRLLSEHPAIVGLAAPGMPRGSPGMEVPGGSKDSFDVLSFDKSGATKVFAHH